MKTEYDYYINNGYCIIKNLFLEMELNEILLNIDIDNEKNILIERLESRLFEKKSIKNFIAKMNLNKIGYLYSRFYKKNAWYSLPVHYHQEIFFHKKYGYDITEKDIFLIFLALENHSIENGCLKIIPCSHKYGLLDVDEIIKEDTFIKNWNIKKEVLSDLYNKHGLLNIELNKGDCLIFHPLTIHGSSNNSSPFSRKVFATGITKKEIIENFNKESVHYQSLLKERTEYGINYLLDKINMLKTNKEHKQIT